jgi:hypothetical protein
MDIQVQSFLNSATKLAISVTSSTTVTQLKSLVYAAEGVTTTIMTFYFDGVELASTATMATIGATTGTYIGSSNTIAQMESKADRQLAKLELARLRRFASGDTTKPFYREFNVYDVNLLADPYVSNTATVGTTSTLVAHRPWVSDPDVLASNLEMETGDDLLLESGGFILLE